jgi:NAD(P)-dependent dehydrogenase (short-subunit alcohol dehydrogenase family)
LTMLRPVCVITGATSGIGRAAALELAGRGAHVVMLGRRNTVGDALARSARERGGGDRSTFIRTDLSDFGQVRSAAREITSRFDRLDVLINNAGARNDRYLASVDGLELTFAANHLGHFLLTCLLLERLLSAPAARILTMSSGAHYSAVAGDDWEQRPATYDRRQAYARSKLANVMFAYALATRLRGSAATSNALEPGGVASGFARNNGFRSWLRHLGAHLIRRDLSLPTTAARAVVSLALDPSHAGRSGCYFSCASEARSSPLSYDTEAAERLWQLSLRKTGLTVQECSCC